MLETIKALTTEYDMLPRGGTVLCAVSGGADSMCLLHLLHTWAGEGGFRVAAAHYNHNLRGAESDRDAAFVAEWCAGQDIPCVIGAGDVAHEARARGLGVEETARQMRYEFLTHRHRPQRRRQPGNPAAPPGAGGGASWPGGYPAPAGSGGAPPAHHLPGGDCGLPGG